MTDAITKAVEALKDLRTNAALLQQNSEGCAVHHYGEDFSLYGLPGWLADTAASIARADEALAALTALQPSPAREEAEALVKRLYAADPYDTPRFVQELCEDAADFIARHHLGEKP